eukprot:TRINITY_DN6083_c0_g1_i2.p1 TRINITY_DN6083_c0_g1~~TRINITY_DN6083_c0_g1_i2.p1  ORF type:complete len:1537 (+),score=483.83 TRINITY_DN6083_c0_g1_i2:261-4613(+)
MAHHSCYGNAPCGKTCLHPSMADCLLKLAEDGVVQVNSIAGASHSRNSAHYQGTVLDIGRYKGSLMTTGNPRDTMAVINTCIALGANRNKIFNANLNCGPVCRSHSTWVHVRWTTPVPTPPLESDDACLNAGGFCWNSAKCGSKGGVTTSGLCKSHPADVTCCSGIPNDGKCSAVGGTCKAMGKCSAEGGSDQSGLCTHFPAEVRCCVPAVPAPAPPPPPPATPCASGSITMLNALKYLCARSVCAKEVPEDGCRSDHQLCALRNLEAAADNLPQYDTLRRALGSPSAGLVELAVTKGSQNAAAWDAFEAAVRGSKCSVWEEFSDDYRNPSCSLGQEAQNTDEGPSCIQGVPAVPPPAPAPAPPSNCDDGGFKITDGLKYACARKACAGEGSCDGPHQECAFRSLQESFRAKDLYREFARRFRQCDEQGDDGWDGCGDPEMSIMNAVQYFSTDKPHQAAAWDYLAGAAKADDCSAWQSFVDQYRKKKSCSSAGLNDVSKGSACSPPAPPPAPAPAPAPPAGSGCPRDLPLDTSNPAIRLIHEFENFFSCAYRDPRTGGLPITIGYGTTYKKDGSPWHLGECITKAQAEDIFNYQIKRNYWDRLAARVPRWGDMNSYQQGALLSFAYNLGAAFYGASGFETMSALLKKGPCSYYTGATAPSLVRSLYKKFGSTYGWTLSSSAQYSGWDLIHIAMAAYRNPGSNVEVGLLRRRIAEGELWRKCGTACGGGGAPAPAPSPSAGDAACGSAGGACKDDGACDAETHDTQSGLCLAPASKSKRCCIPRPSDPLCVSAGGKCVGSAQCGASTNDWQSGLCKSFGASIKCCVPRPQDDPGCLALGGSCSAQGDCDPKRNDWQDANSAGCPSGEKCCAPIPYSDECADKGGDCTKTCDGDTHTNPGTLGCPAAHSCCVPRTTDAPCAQKQGDCTKSADCDQNANRFDSGLCKSFPAGVLCCYKKAAPAPPPAPAPAPVPVQGAGQVYTPHEKDAKCTARGGLCHYASTQACPKHWTNVKGLCGADGSADYVCCAPPSDDGKCTALGGTCIYKGKQTCASPRTIQYGKCGADQSADYVCCAPSDKDAKCTAEGGMCRQYGRGQGTCAAPRELASGLCGADQSADYKCCRAKGAATAGPDILVPLQTFKNAFPSAKNNKACGPTRYTEACARRMWEQFNLALHEGDITTCNRISAFIAQVGHESAGLRYFEEIASGAAYEGRCRDLGNCQAGDGRRFKGRGPIQLTGRANYRNAGRDLGLDLVGNPASVATPEVGFKTTVWFWTKNNLNRYCTGSTADFRTLTRRINGGYNGMQDRLNRWAAAKRDLGSSCGGSFGTLSGSGAPAAAAGASATMWGELTNGQTVFSAAASREDDGGDGGNVAVPVPVLAALSGLVALCGAGAVVAVMRSRKSQSQAARAQDFNATGESESGGRFVQMHSAPAAASEGRSGKAPRVEETDI